MVTHFNKSVKENIEEIKKDCKKICVQNKFDQYLYCVTQYCYMQSILK